MPKNSKITDPDNPEWTREEMAGAMRFKDLPASLRGKLSAIQEASRGKRGPQKSPTKMLISIRLSPDVLSALKATGKGWQSTADEALRRKFVKGSAKA